MNCYFSVFEVNKREYRIDWLAKKSEYISKIKSTTNDEDFFNALQSILSELNNYHVSMLDKNFYLYAKNVFEENSKLYGPWLKQFNNPKAIARYSNMSETENNLKPSSEAFAVFAKSTGFATLVGERTSGDGIGSDPAFCVLPNSGYIFNFSEQMGLTADGTCNFEYKTEPDIIASAKMDSNISNDELVQYVLKLVEQSEI